MLKFTQKQISFLGGLTQTTDSMEKSSFVDNGDYKGPDTVVKGFLNYPSQYGFPHSTKIMQSY